MKTIVTSNMRHKVINAINKGASSQTEIREALEDIYDWEEVDAAIQDLLNTNHIFVSEGPCPYDGGDYWFERTEESAWQSSSA